MSEVIKSKLVEDEIVKNTVETAISIPLQDFQKVEAVRKERHLSRSALLLQAFHAWLELQQTADLEQIYTDSYQARPEKDPDIESLFQSGLHSMSDQDGW